MQTYFYGFDDELSSLSQEQVQGITSYRDAHYRALNKMLREDKEIPDKLKNTQKSLDSSFSSFSLKDDIVLKRGVGANAAEFFSTLEVGDTYTDKAYVSTTISDDTLDKFSTGEDDEYIIHINAKSGQEAIPMQNMGDETTRRTYDDEFEFLLPRDLKYKVVGKEGNIIKLEIV